MPEGHFEGRTQCVSPRLLVSGLFTPWGLSPATPFSTESPHRHPSMLTLPINLPSTYHRSQLHSAGPPLSPRVLRAPIYPVYGGSHRGHSAKAFRGQREMAEGTSRQWNGTGIGDRVLCGWRSPCPLDREVWNRRLARVFSTHVFAAVAGKGSPGDHGSLP